MKDIVVIGGGFAGLSLVFKLLSDRSTFSRSESAELNILILEKSLECGGRMQTKYKSDEDWNVIFEMGAWRIPDTHRRMHTLISQINQVGSRPYGTPQIQLRKGPRKISSGDHKSSQFKVYDTALSKFDKSLLDQSVQVDEEDPILRTLQSEMSTGYYGIWDQAFHTEAAHLAYTTTADTLFTVPQYGFTHIIRSLLNYIEHHPKVSIQVQSCVKDVIPTDDAFVYKVLYTTPSQSKAIQECKSVSTRQIVVACPPHACAQWPTYAKYTTLHRSIVKTVPLCHMYAQFFDPVHLDHLHRRPGTEYPVTHQVVSHSILQQLSLSPYANSQFHQVSYTAGRLATFWNRLYLASPHACVTAVKRELSKLGISQKFRNLQVCYWPRAIHTFRGGYGFNKPLVVQNAICPNPTMLSGVFQVGEAMSSYQGWGEGCLETVELVIPELCENIMNGYAPKHNVRDQNGERPNNITVLSFNGRRLKIDHHWLNRHPGGPKAISSHISDGNVSEAIHRVQHSDDALAIMYHLSLQH